VSKDRLLFLTILLEGYVVLASELLAIRTLIPFVGSGTEVVAIVISAVLLPLAAGYHVGGQRFQKAQAARNGKVVSIRKLLLKNLLSAMLPLSLGFSYVVQELFFALLVGIGISHHIPQTAVFCLVFLVYPVFLLAQTIPLLSNYFSRRHLSEITGRMLFFSTLGSFAGSVFSTIVLMMWIGVHYTLVFTMALLAALVLMLTRRWHDFDNVIALFVLGVVYLLNNQALLRDMDIVANNQYSIVRIYEDAAHERRIMDINRSTSSAYAKNPENRFKYLQFIEKNVVNPAIASDSPKKFLILGAGGFTLGVDDDLNDYTFVDIDASLKKTAETHLLPTALGANKKFVPMSARVFLVRDTEKYDFIMIDLYTHQLSIPMEATTVEFLQAVKRHLKPGAVVIANVIGSPDFSDLFTVRYNNTFRSVFPHFTLQVTGALKPWGAPEPVHNMLYVYHHRPEFMGDAGVYTDDLNSYSLDR